MTKTEPRAPSNKDSKMLVPPIGGKDTGHESHWPPKVVWAREQGWLNVRDPWGVWHSIPARQAPTGYARIATIAKRGEA